MSLPTSFELLKRGVHTMGTIRTGRLSGIKPLICSDKELEAKKKRAWEEYEVYLSGLETTVKVVR